LKDAAKPYLGKAIPQIHKATLMKELVGIGALKRQYHQIGLSDIYNPKEG
jgi:hypothetical protein